MARLMKKQGKISGSVEVKKLTEKKDKISYTPPVETDGTSVGASIGLTLSENYQSVNVQATVTLPTIFAEKEAAMEEAWRFVDAELSERLDDAKKLMKAV